MRLLQKEARRLRTTIARMGLKWYSICKPSIRPFGIVGFDCFDRQFDFKAPARRHRERGFFLSGVIAAPSGLGRPKTTS
jgi:hypothetical protein